jgi:type II secretory pathway pseudopilin PulG
MPVGKHRAGRFQPASGFTYIGLLIAIALMSIALVAASEVWVTTARHQKMVQMEWIGEQYVQGIGSYYYANVGSVRFYPKTLDDLLEDKRYLSIRRHLRQLYKNPMTEQLDWKLIPAPDGGIAGVETEVEMPTGAVRKAFVFAPDTVQ